MGSDTYTILIAEVRTYPKKDETPEQWLGHIKGFYVQELAGLPQGTLVGISELTVRYLRGDQFTNKEAEWLDPVNKRCRAAFEKAVGVKLPKTIKGTMAVLNRT